jgi:hypothetical protein
MRAILLSRYKASAILTLAASSALFGFCFILGAVFSTLKRTGTTRAIHFVLGPTASGDEQNEGKNEQKAMNPSHDGKPPFHHYSRALTSSFLEGVDECHLKVLI